MEKEIWTEEMESRVPEDGTLTIVPYDPDLYKDNNIMIIKIPDHLRSPSGPFFQVATIDRSKPGNDFEGNRILDKLIPGLPKVTVFEEPKPIDDSPSPPPEQYVPKQKFVKTPHTGYSNSGSRSRPPHYKKPWLEKSNKPNPDEISPWVPGNEPYISHANTHIPAIPLRAESRHINLVKYHDKSVNDQFVPHRESHPKPQKYPHNPASFGDGPHNYSGGFGDGTPTNYSGGFGDGLPSNYSGGFCDGPPPSGRRGHHRSNFNNPVAHSFGNHNPNSRGGNNQPYESNRGFRKNNFSKRSRSHDQRGAFQNRGIETRSFHSNAVQQPITFHKARGKPYAANKRSEVDQNQRTNFNRRGRRNY